MNRSGFRKIVLALEGVEGRPHMDRTAFRTRRKTFATLGADSRLHLAIEPEERREALLESFPDTFFSLGGWTRLGYVAVDLAKVDDDMLRELVTDAYHDALPRRAATTPRAKHARPPAEALPAKAAPGDTNPLANVPTATRAIVETARETIRGLAPRAAEEIACASKRPRSASTMWKLVRFAVGKETVVTVGTFTRHASMFFGRGAELPDPQGILEGSGKSLRYITLRSPVDAARPAVKALVKKAFALARRS